MLWTWHCSTVILIIFIRISQERKVLGMLRFLNSISETAIRKLKSDIHCTGAKVIAFFSYILR